MTKKWHYWNIENESIKIYWIRFRIL